MGKRSWGMEGHLSDTLMVEDISFQMTQSVGEFHHDAANNAEGFGLFDIHLGHAGGSSKRISC